MNSGLRFLFARFTLRSTPIGFKFPRQVSKFQHNKHPAKNSCAADVYTTAPLRVIAENLDVVGKSFVRQGMEKEKEGKVETGSKQDLRPVQSFSQTRAANSVICAY